MDASCSVLFMCGYCGIKQPNMEHCSTCFSIAYCSKDCEKKSKPKHEHYCINKTNPFRNLNAICKYCTNITSDFQEKRECPGCSHTVYCSRTCLAKDWINHKNECLGILKIYNNNGDETRRCIVCHSTESVKRCIVCKTVDYCSKDCQRKDWKNHKHKCIKPVLRNKIEIEEKLREMRMLEIRCLNHLQRSGETYTKMRPDDDFSVNLYDDYADVTILKRSNKTQWKNTVHAVRSEFPDYEVFTKFQMLKDIPRDRTLLISFIPRYHNYRGRHCVYLEDDTEEELYAAFYFKIANFPGFSWSEIKPGRFIIVRSPKLYTFRDHTTGFRFEDPSRLKFIDP